MPGMRLGWMLPPSWVSWALISAKAIEDAGSETAGQLALADFIARGELERHLRRMRLRYDRRRECFFSALAPRAPGLAPAEGGGRAPRAHGLPDYVDEPALLRPPPGTGVGLEGLSLHSYTGEGPPGLVLGHAYMAEPAIERGVRLLAEAEGRDTSSGISSSAVTFAPRHWSYR